MSTTLSALEEVVDRHGRDALADPLTLTAALRSLTSPPPEDDVTALAAAAGAGATGSIRSALADGATPEQALDAAAEATSGPRERWASAQLGAALGLLPHALAEDPDRTTTVSDPVTPAATATLAEPPAPTGSSGTGGAGRANRGRRAAVLGGVAVLVLAAAVGGGLVLSRGGPADGQAGGPPPGPAAPPATAGQEPAAAPDPTASDPQSSDPRAAFTDEVLLTTAEPYLRSPGTTCERDPDPLPVLRESVTCRLGTGGGAGIFTRYYDPTSVVQLRTLTGTDETAVPGSRRTLRWEYVAGRPGVRAGIPVGVDRPGVGTRIRWLGLDSQAPLLYFDEDATGVAVQLGLLDGGDQERLRLLWADPNG